MDPETAAKRNKRQCRYSAKCGVTRKFLAAKSRNGEIVSVAEVARQGDAEHQVDINV